MRSKNVLILHTDQQRYNSLGCAGNKYAISPNIDYLASCGSVFTRHIAANPICMPSRASFFTGLYPSGHNVWTNGVPLNRGRYIKYEKDNHHSPYLTKEDVCPEPPTLADMFSSAGYDTVSFGKLHLTPNLAHESYGYEESWKLWATGKLNDWHGPYYGFRYVDMTLGHGEQPCTLGGHYALWLQKEAPGLYRKVMAGESQKNRPMPAQIDLYPSLIPSELHNTTWLAERFCDYLKKQQSSTKPFFAFVGFPDPHHSFTPSYDIVKQFEDIDVKEPFDPDGKGVQHSPGLKELHSVKGLTEKERKTIIRYTYAMVCQVDMAIGKVISALKDTGLWEDTIIIFTSDHGDFLCDHGLLYKAIVGSDSLLHIPFILRVPGIELPRILDVPMSNCDVMPTLASLVGIDIRFDIHGRDIMSLNKEDSYVFAFCFNGALEKNNYTVYDRYHRLTYYPYHHMIELFDHRSDPGEVYNKANEKKDISEHLLNILKEQFLKYSNPILNRVGAW